jgi:hypothetical protein
MWTSASAIVIRSRLIAVVVTVVALFFVPPIVRATSTLKSSAPLRLNRGFETPPPKADAVRSLEQAFQPASAPRLEPLRLSQLPLLQTPLPHTPTDHSPEPQRGPPAFPLR